MRLAITLTLLWPTSALQLPTLPVVHRASPPIMMAKKPPPARPGYYARPSAAVEQGGGFYVPGLEGSRLRVVAAAVLSAALVFNRVLSPGEPASSQIVSEVLGAVGCAIIFVQSAAQQAIEREMEQDALRAAFAARLKDTQELSDAVSSTARARWAAGALLRVTSARAVVWTASDGSLLMRFGRFPDSDGVAADGADASLRSLLPSPNMQSAVLAELGASGRAPPPLPSNAASVAVCSCGDGVLALASEQPSAFTEKHLGWLQSCARYLEE